MPYPSGLFWTVPVAPSSVQLDLGKASASYHLTDFRLVDFGSLANAFFNGSSVPATVSFHLDWHMLQAPDVQTLKIRDTSQGYAGEFWQSQAAGAATLAWSGSEAGFSFVSDPASTSSSYFAELGHERNGVFFPQGLSAHKIQAGRYVRLK